jgi:hypothetical protein
MIDMINPEEKIISVLELSNGVYVYNSYNADKEVPLISVPGCAVDFGKVFTED